MDDVLRRSVAHVLVDDVTAPVVDGPTDHHLRRVLRVRDGEVVTVTDGRGRWRACRARADGLDADGDVMHVESAGPLVTLAVATPKGDRAEWLVQKCTEIGVDRIVLLRAEHSVVRWTGERADRHVDRLRRVMVEAAMQSRRVWLPELTGPLPAGQVLTDAVAAEPGGRPLTPADHTIAVGPEGGWSPAEITVAHDTVSLGPTVLRVETAAVVAVTRMVAHREAMA